MVEADSGRVPETEGLDFDPFDPVVVAMMVKCIVLDYLTSTGMLEEGLANTHSHLIACHAGVGAALLSGLHTDMAKALDWIQREFQAKGAFYESLQALPFVSEATVEALKLIDKRGEQRGLPPGMEP